MVGVGETQHDSHSWADPDGIQMFVIRINVPSPVAGERITFSFDHEVGVERSIGCTVTNMEGNEIELRMGGQAVGGCARDRRPLTPSLPQPPRATAPLPSLPLPSTLPPLPPLPPTPHIPPRAGCTT